MNFKKLQLDDIASVKPALYEYAPNQANDYTATGLFLWRDYLDVYVAFEPDGVYIYQHVDDVYLFYFPLCKDPEAGFKKIADYCTSNKLPYGFYPFTAEETAYLDRAGIKYKVVTSDDYNDYLHKIEDFAEFRGKAFHSQKNHINKFNKEYDDFSFERISAENLADVKAFFDDYATEKLAEQLSATEHEELLKIPELLDHMDDYNLFGYCIKIDGKVQGFELGEIVGNMYYSHIQKANRNIDGIYTKIINSVAIDLRDKVTFINREEDLGEAGLRDAKQRYHPCGFIKKEMIFAVV